jgi:cytochrome c553
MWRSMWRSMWRAIQRASASALLCFAASHALAESAPVSVPVPDTIAQRVQACTFCHGKEGRATGEGYFPRIAGKPAGYLYHQLLNFREGRRHNRTMGYLIANMSDAYLMEIATYFSELDLPYAPVATNTGTPAEIERGRLLVTEGDASQKIPACVQCHGQAMTGVAPFVPGLLGLPKPYLVAQFGAWRTSQRQAKAPDCMNQISRQLSHEDLNAVASYLSQRPLPADPHPAASVPLPLPLECGSLAK